MSGPPLLAISHVSKRFGGLRALDEVSLEVAGGEIVGLIGPNGAGKTTLFSALVGLHRIDKGAIRFDGSEVHRLESHRVAALGLTKTFQNVALFSEMSVLENVLVGGLLRHGLAAARGTAQGCLERVGLSSIANKRAAVFLVSRARAGRSCACARHGTEAAPSGRGHGRAERRREAQMIGLIRTLRDDGLTLIVIEHHMHTIMTLCDRVVALSFGRIIAEGAPAEIARIQRSSKLILAANVSSDGRSPLLRVADLRASYGDAEVLHGVSLDLAPGDLLCVIGANTAGKSTLLRAISRLSSPRLRTDRVRRQRSAAASCS